jgi:hypothetical protein
VVILTPGDRIIALLLKNCFFQNLLKDPYDLAPLIHNRPDRLPKAAGSKSMPRILKDGNLGYLGEQIYCRNSRKIPLSFGRKVYT